MEITEFRKTGHSLVDLIADYLSDIENKPLFPDVEPKFLKEIFDEPIPEHSQPIENIIGELKEKLLPYCTQVNHPCYFGLITPTPTPAGILGDFLASALNQNLGVYSIGPSAVAIERRTIQWLCDLAGYGVNSGGNLTSGGMTANFIGLKLARDWTSGNNAQHNGIRDKWTVYVSEERHVSIDKAVDAVGIGRNFLRAIPTDDEFKIRLDLLEEKIKDDLNSGMKPVCIIGLAGTTNTGSVDDLLALRKIAGNLKVWFHVDAAYGGGVLISEKRKGLLKGIETADSITIDPHKWFYAPLDAGAILVKDESQLTKTFGIKPAYLTDELDKANERYQYYVHSFEQSRRFRSLKVWMSFKRYGTKQIGKWIDANIEQAEHLFNLVEKNRLFKAVVKPQMSAICIRYNPGNIDEDNLAKLHHEVVRKIELGGRFWISTTVLKSLTWFRINPVNFRTRKEHMAELLALIEKECKNLKEKSSV
jgi:aromatic-L-amino-acid/L-tryptophan decarboxylase